ncbi:MFS transporter [Actinospica sp.]|jgi:MFS family permease|uniref:MFS transporter n=1 Tax=Actinospica sp. TaxID=1872142 RepID=UPI002BEBD9C2|nr:MFS transporter [Actinospica sp.]HWG23399.1 MFS transporter [Actinospica sp.]
MSPDRRRLGRARLGILSTFALAGALCAVWTVRMPALKQKLDLTDAQLGLEVLGWGVGALITMTIAGRIIGRHGSRNVLRFALPGTAFCLALVGLAPNYALLIAAGLVFGLCFGLVDVAMNTQASTVERAYGRPLMGGMHAGWSLGAVAGGLVGAATAWLGFGFTGALCLFAVVGLPLTLAVGPLYLPESARTSSAGHAESPRPRLPLLVYLFGALVFCSYLTEGSIADWSGVYLRDSLGSVETVAALGYPMFEASMFLGRMFADRLTTRLGARTLIMSAGVVAAAAFALVVFAPTPTLALAGFALVGLGVCVVTPLAMSLAGAAGGADTERAIAAASTFGYSGLLLGPVVIGFVSAATSMRIGYAVVIGVCVAIALSARFVPRGRHIEDRGNHGDAVERSGDPGVRCEVAV